MLAEASVVPRTVADLHRLSVNVEVLAVLVIAFAETLEKVANWHLVHVVLVEKLAVVSLLAEVSQPVLAHNGTLALCVPEWTVGAPRTHALKVELT